MGTVPSHACVYILTLPLYVMCAALSAAGLRNGLVSHILCARFFVMMTMIDTYVYVRTCTLYMQPINSVWTTRSIDKRARIGL